jgi:CheY-like chemotaxis protein
MTKHEIQPFFFPTTVAFVDDSGDFLANLSLQLDPLLAFRLFQSPIDALATLNSSGIQSSPSVKSLFSLYEGRDEFDLRRQIVDVDLDMIHREIHDDKRFDQISVVVIDYDMPQMNGVEFCRQLKNPLVRRILLTGKADERVAVEAFNEGLIDRFIRKQEPNAIDSLNQVIREMQPHYFSQIGRMLAGALAIGLYRFLKDPRFAECFNKLSDQLNIVEYYLSCAPGGMLMLDATGTSYLLLVQNEEQFRATHEIAYDQQAPDELLKTLRSGDAMPYFWKTQGNYSSIYEDWRGCLHPATKIQGDEWYAYTVVENPKGFNLKHVLFYADYLDRLDEPKRRQSLA